MEYSNEIFGQFEIDCGIWGDHISLNPELEHLEDEEIKPLVAKAAQQAEKVLVFWSEVEGVSVAELATRFQFVIGENVEIVQYTQTAVWYIDVTQSDNLTITIESDDYDAIRYRRTWTMSLTEFSPCSIWNTFRAEEAQIEQVNDVLHSKMGESMSIIGNYQFALTVFATKDSDGNTKYTLCLNDTIQFEVEGDEIDNIDFVEKMRLCLPI